MSCRVIFRWIFSNHKFSYLWNGIYENLFVKYVVLNRFNLLGSSSSSSVDTSSFGCVVILSLYLMMSFVIYSLKVGILKSVCRSLFGIYIGAFTVVRRDLFLYICNISMFELLVLPQMGIPYVQMGFRIVLYISNLFSIDNSNFRPGIQCICWNFEPSCFLLANMCFCHSSLLSRCIPKYLAVSFCESCFPFSVTVGQFSIFKVKVTWVDFLIRQVLTTYRTD
jgi:hypothetical protein